MRKRAIAAALMVIGASLIWMTTAASAALTQINVRVEGKEKTLFEGPILTEGHRVQALSDTEPHPCDGTNNGAHAEAMPTPTASAADAMELSGQVWDAVWYEGFDDYYLNQFGPDHEDNSTGQWWGVLANGAFTPVGGCQYGDRPGDEVLWVYDAFSGRRFLWMAAQGDPTPAPKSPLPTAYVEVGQPLTVLVESHEGGGDTPTRAEGITVAPVTTEAGTGDQKVEVNDPEAVVTNSEGAAEITFSTPGWHRIKAQEEAGYIRSNRIDVCVEPVGGGGCGPRPADSVLRTPPRYVEKEEEKPAPPTPEGGGRTGDDTKSTTGESQKPAATPPVNVVATSRAAVDPKSGTALLSIAVPGAGQVTMAGKKTITQSVSVAGPSTVALTVKPNAKERRGLRKRGWLRVGVKIAYTPTGGTTAYTWRSVQLKAGAKK
ncbi:MAG: hypothetical protein BGO11_15610 [Solirubrobacterales bacterium 70-9]|nr:MAG: hypothetical protein BGO11_15610 [Solirubrobacterales bacterium 70-9]